VVRGGLQGGVVSDPLSRVSAHPRILYSVWRTFSRHASRRKIRLAAMVFPWCVVARVVHDRVLWHRRHTPSCYPRRTNLDPSVPYVPRYRTVCVKKSVVDGSFRRTAPAQWPTRQRLCVLGAVRAVWSKGRSNVWLHDPVFGHTFSLRVLVIFLLCTAKWNNRRGVRAR